MKKIKILLKIMLVASIFSVNTLQANVVSARLADQAIQPGDVFSLTISGSGFDVPLDAGGLDISFDSNIIQVAPLSELPDGVASQVVLDPLWDVDSPRAPVINDNSVNDIFFFTSGFDAKGDFDIVSIWFKAITGGKSPVKLVESQLNPFAGGGGALAVELQNREVQVQTSVVPVPAAIWFMGSGLIGLVSLRRFI